MAKDANTKGQIIGQIFIYILAGLVFVLIIAYGYRAITYFLERQEQVVLVDFRTDLETAVENVKRDYGTVRKLTLKLPDKYSGVCFLDAVLCAPSTPQLILPGQTISAPWAQDACAVKSANVFIVPRALDLFLPDVQVDKGFVCIPNTGGITIRLEGTGKKAKISQWQ
ncbi:MAG: hypothetical protein QW165_03770 [Candidatus Woesearchaeota archaeon]